MHNSGSINSIGNVIFLAGKNRFACANSTFMFHGVGKNIDRGTIFEKKDIMEMLDSFNAGEKQIASVLNQSTSMTVEQIDQLFTQAATKNADFAKTVGIVTDVKEISILLGTPSIQLVFNS